MGSAIVGNNTYVFYDICMFGNRYIYDVYFSVGVLGMFLIPDATLEDIK